MKVNCRSLLDRTRRRFACAVAFLLLAGIVYSVSFGTVHRHGDAKRLDQSAIGTLAGTASASLNIPAVGRSLSDECLICVLHQQLFNSTVDRPHFVVTSEPDVTLAAAAAVFYHSDPIVSSPVARLSGRAPPSHLG